MPSWLVRNAEGFVSWSRGSHTLRRWLRRAWGDLIEKRPRIRGRLGRLGVTIAHVAWPYGEHIAWVSRGRCHSITSAPEVHHQLLEISS